MRAIIINNCERCPFNYEWWHCNHPDSPKSDSREGSLQELDHLSGDMPAPTWCPLRHEGAVVQLVEV